MSISRCSMCGAYTHLNPDHICQECNAELEASGIFTEGPGDERWDDYEAEVQDCEWLKDDDKKYWS